MTAEKRPAGAVFRRAMHWQDIRWIQVHREVRRLQVRIVKAPQEGRWGKVRALQHLLTHLGNCVLVGKAFERLEPDEGKLSRPVLRGRGRSNVSLLPGAAGERGRKFGRKSCASNGGWMVTPRRYALARQV